MEAISDLLKNCLGATENGQQDSTPLNPNAAGFVSSRDYANAPGTPKPEVCKFCGKTLYHDGVFVAGRILWTPFASRCTCPDAVAVYEAEKKAQEEKERAEREEKENQKFKERVKKIIGESGMRHRFLQRTFATFQETEENKQALSACIKYARNFDKLLPKQDRPEPGRNGLFVSGPPGTGKTHLAAAISNYLMARGKPVVCMTMIDLLERIKQTFGKSGQDDGAVLQIYKTIPLLVIDDIGKEPREGAANRMGNFRCL